jgi:hypothetical protein
MSRGLGRVERHILAWLLTWRDGKDEALYTLTEAVAGWRDCPDCEPDFRGPRPPRSVYVSVCRAVASLERKGFVRTETRRSYEYRWKVVTVNVDHAADLPAIQHLTCEEGDGR